MENFLEKKPETVQIGAARVDILAECFLRHRRIGGKNAKTPVFRSKKGGHRLFLEI